MKWRTARRYSAASTFGFELNVRGSRGRFHWHHSHSISTETPSTPNMTVPITSDRADSALMRAASRSEEPWSYLFAARVSRVKPRVNRPADSHGR